MTQNPQQFSHIHRGSVIPGLVEVSEREKEARHSPVRTIPTGGNGRREEGVRVSPTNQSIRSGCSKEPTARAVLFRNCRLIIQPLSEDFQATANP